ncbi:hypothetical protein DFH07DRAFT_937794 [Mycena maculata]|uniref:Uncharacterized protein n=1 Tax=Mycena maculata TaxID=230809 RepID=A0AAD7JYS3_9AGAR|nr:hypothetical protein DFH07DRAFT_944834 [Mycena maculata]KAJ7772150.1 hypothetical protein DFH07DRAFT_937794 [Mycena maculata]
MQLSRGVHKTPSGDPAKQVKNHQSLAQVLKSSNFLSLLLGPVDSQAFLLPPPIGLPIRHASSQAAISKGTARHVVSGKSRHVPIIYNEMLRNSWEYSETSSFIRRGAESAPHIQIIDSPTHPRTHRAPWIWIQL